MSSLVQCPFCGSFTLDFCGACNCRPFTITDEDGEECIRYANNEESAALDFAEKSNTENDYWLMNETIEIKVNGTPYIIGAEPDVHYYAKKIDNESTPTNTQQEQD